jgi:hypothetical protein
MTRRTIVNPDGYRRAVTHLEDRDEYDYLYGSEADYWRAHQAAADAFHAQRVGTPHDYRCPHCNAEPGHACLDHEGRPFRGYGGDGTGTHAVRDGLRYPCRRCGASPGVPCDIPPAKRPHHPHHHARVNPDWPDPTGEILDALRGEAAP